MYVKIKVRNLWGLGVCFCVGVVSLFERGGFKSCIVFFFVL